MSPDYYPCWGSMGNSQLEELFAFQLRALGIPEPVREYMFAKPRRWRFDFAWPEHKPRPFAIEIEGGRWVQGRHNRGSGFGEDCEKYNAATALGWDVYRYTEDRINLAINKAAEILGVEIG